MDSKALSKMEGCINNNPVYNNILGTERQILGTLNDNLRCRFTYEKYGIGRFSCVKFSFDILNGNIFTLKLSNSDVKCTGLKFHM